MPLKTHDFENNYVLETLKHPNNRIGLNIRQQNYYINKRCPQLLIIYFLRHLKPQSDKTGAKCMKRQACFIHLKYVDLQWHDFSVE